MPGGVELCAVNLPGRAPRVTESCFKRLVPLAEAAAEGILPYCGEPFALFGHSMGAMLSFEIARYLRQQRFKGPVKLLVSARRAPQVPDDDPPTYNLPDKEFLEELRRINGTPTEVLEHQELLAMFAPIIRADFEACQTYEYKPEPPLDCPIMAFGGVTDDEETRERIEPWSKQSTRSFSLSMLPGGHFFIHTAEELLVRTLGEELSGILSGPV
jgi:medium-chain acyl-[acyl-carrier-protein] hydrolase